MQSSRITRDEWLSALGDAAQPVDPDALSLAEIAEQFGVCRNVADRRLRALVKAGRAIRTWKVITTTSGHPRRVPAYKLVKPKGRK